MTDVTDDSQLCDVTDDQKPPSTRSYLTVGLPDPHPVEWIRRQFFKQVSQLLYVEWFFNLNNLYQRESA